MWGDSWSGGKQLNSRWTKDNDLKDLKENLEFNGSCKAPSNIKGGGKKSYNRPERQKCYLRYW